MHSISQPVKGMAAAIYYFSAYYHGADQSEVHLRGGGAKFLNHEGGLTRAEFENLLCGLSPNGKVKFVQNAGKENRQGGWDLTFSAPKSLSVLWALSNEADRRKLELIHQRACEKAFKYLEKVAGWSRRGKAGHTLERALLVAAIILHGSSRANDPALHTHMFLFNLGFRPDGTTGALWTEELFRQKMAAGQIYRDALSEMLRTELGLTIEPRKVGFHIQGVPQELCDVFSKRRAQILKAMADRGVSGAVAAKIAALKTRPRKENVPPHELKGYWARVGREFGFGPEQAEALLMAGQQSRAQSKEESQPKPQTQTASSGGKNSGDETSEAKPKKRSQAKNHHSSHEQSADNDGNRASGDKKEHKAKRPEDSKPGGGDARDFGKHPFQFRWRLLFPYAPDWSPFKNLKTPYVEAGVKDDFRRWGNIVFRKHFIFAEFRVQQKYLLPNAAGSTLPKLSLPALRILSPSQLRHMKAKKEHFQKITERLSH